MNFKMPTTQENLETKAGHPPALKVGGMRVVQRQRRDSEETPKTSKEKNEKTNEEAHSSTFNPFKPQVLVTGVAPKVDQKDFPKEEIKHAHDKPIPTHQPAHQNKPSVIQQPRK